MKQLLFTIVLCAFGFQIATSQNTTDALRYSVLVPGGSARVIGSGNAFGAMGGDYGVGAINVAGLADFRSTEITFSTSYNQPSTTSTIAGNMVGESSNGNKVLIENIALIKHNKPYYSNSFVTSNIAIGFQQYTNFDQVYSYETESIGSITEYFADQANFEGWSDFYSELAFESGAIFDDENDDQGEFYLSDLLYEDFTNKEQVIERSGSYNEFQFAWAGKTKGGLSLGIGIGVPIISFEERKFYEENDTDDSPQGFNRLVFNESLTTSGAGINAKVGLGYNLKNKLRLGLAYQSPTWLRLEDVFYNTMLYECESCTGLGIVESPDGRFTYGLRTPMKVTGSIGGMTNLEKIKGFLNLDVQYIDYTENSFNFTLGGSGTQADAEAEAFENDVIDRELASGFNYSLGGELVFGRYRARAGFSSQLKPFNNEIDTDNIYGAGLGYRANQFYLDMAFQFRSIREGYIPYPTEIDREVFLLNDADLQKVVVTFGVKL